MHKAIDLPTSRFIRKVHDEVDDHATKTQSRIA